MLAEFPFAAKSRIAEAGIWQVPASAAQKIAVGGGPAASVAAGAAVAGAASVIGEGVLLPPFEAGGTF